MRDAMRKAIDSVVIFRPPTLEARRQNTAEQFEHYSLWLFDFVITP